MDTDKGKKIRIDGYVGAELRQQVAVGLALSLHRFIPLFLFKQ